MSNEIGKRLQGDNNLGSYDAHHGWDGDHKEYDY